MKIYIGIDPDVDKSGIAYYEHESQRLELSALKFFELYDYLQYVKVQWPSEKTTTEITVIIEAGWLNKKSNFHHRLNQTKQAGERIGKNVGSNHETGKKIGEMCEYLGLQYEFVRPMGKMNPEYFKEMTGMINTKNQEMIDAACLVLGR